MKLTPKNALALVLTLAGLGLVVTGAVRHQPLVTVIGWLALSCCGFLVAAIVYRHVVALLDRIDTLSALTRQVNGQLQASTKASARQFKRVEGIQEGHSQALAGLKVMHASTQQLQADMRAQVQRVEEAGRTASRQSADGQHFVLNAYRELTDRHRQQEQLIERLAGQLDHLVRSVTEARSELRMESGQLVSQIGSQGTTTLARLEEHVGVIVGEIGRAGVEAREGTAAKLDLVKDQMLKTLSSRDTEGSNQIKAELDQVQSKVVSEIGRSRTEALHETESMLQLVRLFKLRAPVPLLGGWAMEPSSMLSLVGTILQRKPDLVVECGSGTSTVWLAYALAANGKGRLVSFDHEPEYAAATARSLALHGMEAIVDLRLAPLVEQAMAGEEYSWYDPARLTDLEGIDVLIVDGPPSATGPLARYPAVPLLGKHLSDQALVIVDDANRKDEKAIMRRWKDELPGLGEPVNLASRTALIEFHRTAG